MNAIQPSRPRLQPVPSRRESARTSRRTAKQRQRRLERNAQNRAMAAEASAKIAVNVVLSLVAVSTLVNLLPSQRFTQDKLREIRSEVKLTETRVNRLRADFTRYFDPQQTPSNLVEQSYRVDPSKRQIIFLENSTAPDEAPAEPEP